MRKIKEHSAEEAIQPAQDTATERWVLTATILASSMAFIDGSALNVALPALQADLQANGAQLLWIINAYMLMLAALILVGGSLGDRLGRKKVFMAGIGLFGIASLACGLAPSIEWLIAARILQGIGGALMIPGSLAIISATVAPGRRGRAIGTWSAATTLVTVAGPLLGGIFSDLGFWRGVFLINLPLGVFALAVLHAKVPESRNESETGPIDLPGAILITLGLSGLAYGFISGPELGFGSPWVIGTILGGIAALVGFGLVEARRSEPMLPLHLFRSRSFSGANLLTLFLYGGLSAWSFFFSLNLVQAQGYSKTAAGLAFLPFTILLTALSRWAGGLVDRRGPRLLLIAGPLVTGLGFLAIGLPGLTRGPADFWTTFFPGIALVGAGMGLTVAPLTTTVMGSVPQDYSGTASGINNAVSRTAGVLAVAGVGALALLVFAGSLRSQTASLDLPVEAQAAIQHEASKLGDARVPAQVEPAKAPAVAAAIRLSFVNTFRLVTFICAGLAWISALAAAVLIEPRLDVEGEGI